MFEEDQGKCLVICLAGVVIESVDMCPMVHVQHRARANHQNPGFVTHVCESLTLWHHRTDRHQSWSAPMEKKLAQESNKHSSRPSACVRVKVNAWKTFCSGSHDTSCRHRLVTSQMDNKCTTGMLILHAEASFTSAERGLRGEILSRVSLKCHIQFGSFLSIQFSFANAQKVCGFWRSAHDQQC